MLSLVVATPLGVRGGVAHKQTTKKIAPFHHIHMSESAEGVGREKFRMVKKTDVQGTAFRRRP